MKLNKVQEKKLRQVVNTLKDRMVEELISEGLPDLVSDILGRETIGSKLFVEVTEEILYRLFKK